MFFNCPYCAAPIEPPNVPMDGVVCVCDSCVRVSIVDNGVARQLDPQESAEFTAGPGGELLEQIKKARKITD